MRQRNLNSWGLPDGQSEPGVRRSAAQTEKYRGCFSVQQAEERSDIFSSPPHKTTLPRVVLLCEISHDRAVQSSTLGSMKATIQTFRALTATVFRRAFIPAAWIVGSVITALYLLTFYLGGWVHPFWWLLLVVLMPVTLVVVALAAAAWYLSGRLFPRPLTVAEQTQIKDFSDKIIRVAEVRATPIPIVFMLIAKDVIRGKNSSYIESIVDDSASLKDDFLSLRNMFVPKNLS